MKVKTARDIIVKKFTWEIIGGQYEAIIKEMIKTAGE